MLSNIPGPPDVIVAIVFVHGRIQCIFEHDFNFIAVNVSDHPSGNFSDQYYSQEDGELDKKEHFKLIKMYA